MSTTIQDKNGVSITQFAGGAEHGICFQVTWRSEDPEQLFNFVSFNNRFDAEKFAELLEKRLVR